LPLAFGAGDVAAYGSHFKQDGRGRPGAGYLGFPTSLSRANVLYRLQNFPTWTPRAGDVQIGPCYVRIFRTGYGCK
jgi:hypothetical protein